MIISGLADYRDGNAYEWQTATTSTITLTTYQPNTSSAKTSGQEDRFYVAGVSLTSSNFQTEGTLVATDNTSGIGQASNYSTTITLTGLQPGKRYFIFAARFESGSPTGLYGNSGRCAIGHTTYDEIEITPAKSTHSFDPSADSFFDWFNIGGEYYEPWITATRMSDGNGDFMRVGVYKNQSLNLVSKKKLSPRHDWSLEFKFRHNGNQGSTAQQYDVGFISGHQACLFWQFFRQHAINLSEGDLWGERTINWPAWYAPYDQLTNDGTSNTVGAHWFSGYSADIAMSGASPLSYSVPGQNWLIRPDHLHANFATNWGHWQQAIDEIKTVRFDYDASTYTVSQYVDNVLIAQFKGSDAGIFDDDVPTLRRKYPDGHYSLPITAAFRFQYLTSSTYIDIYEMNFSTQCPQDYAGYVTSGGMYGTWYGLPNDYGIHYADASSCDIVNNSAFLYLGEGGSDIGRYTVGTYQGLTIKPDNWTGYEGYLIYHDDTYNFPAHPTWSSGTHELSIPPINIPSGKTAHKVDFQGIPRYGSITGRIYDQNGDPVTGYITITGVDGQSQVTIPEDPSVTKLVPKFRVIHDGTDPAVGQYTPSLIVGMSAELMLPTFEVSESSSSSTIDAIALESTNSTPLLNNATTYCGLAVENIAAEWVSPHPSVIDFQQTRNSGGTIMNTFGGYRYWGASTTMGLESGAADAEAENPFAFRSNNPGSSQTLWTTQVQLDDYGDSGGNQFLTPGDTQAPDPFLIYDKTNNLIRAFWVRETVGGSQTEVMTRTINSSMSLGVRQVSLDCSVQGQVLSPALVYDDSGYLHMWYTRDTVNTGGTPPGGTIWHTKSTYHSGEANHATVWDTPVQCSPSDLVQQSVNSNLQYWHLGASRVDGEDTVMLFPFCSNIVDGWGGSNAGIYLIETDISNPTQLSLAATTPVLTKSTGSPKFDNYFVYQPAPVAYRDGTALKADIFYAGSGSLQANWIALTGFTTGTLVSDFFTPGSSVVDINTLGVTYGSPIAGTALSTILNNNNEVLITGAVIFTGNLTLDNPNLVITSGTDNGTPYLQGTSGYISIKQFLSIDGLDGLWASSGVRFPGDSTATGTISNINHMNSYVKFGDGADNTLQFGGTQPQNEGLTFENITNGFQCLGLSSGAIYRNVAFQRSSSPYGAAIGSGESILKLNGRDNVFEDCTMTCLNFEINSKFIPTFMGWGQGSSTNNTFTRCTFNGGEEEMVGWDHITGSGNHEVATVSSVTGNVVNVSHLLEFSTFTNGTESAVGAHIFVLSGSNAGAYYEVVGHSTTQLTVSSDRFPDAEVLISAGNQIQIAPMFIENTYDDCDFNITSTSYAPNGYGQHVALSIWAGCAGNLIKDCRITNTRPSDPRSIGIYDASVLGQYGPGTPQAIRMSGRNLYLNNTITDCQIDIICQTCLWDDSIILGGGDDNEGENLAKPPTFAYSWPRQRGSVFIGNTSTGGTNTSMHEARDIVWNNPGLSVSPATSVYDETYLSSPFLSPQPPLGGSAVNTTAPGYSTYSLSGNEITLLAWAGATIYYCWDDPEGSYSTYSAPLNTSGGTVLYYYANEGAYTTIIEKITTSVSDTFAISETASASTIETVTLEANGGTFSVDETSSSSTIDNVTLEEAGGTFTIAEAASASTMDSFAISLSGGTFAIAESSSTSTAEVVTLSLSGGTFTIAEAASASTMDSFAISLSGGTFAIAESSSASTAETLTLSLASSIFIIQDVLIPIEIDTMIIGVSEGLVNLSNAPPTLYRLDGTEADIRNLDGDQVN